MMTGFLSGYVAGILVSFIVFKYSPDFVFWSLFGAAIIAIARMIHERDLERYGR